MSPVFSARRRADDFDNLVEAAASGRAVEDARFDDLLALTTALRSAPPVQARPEFVADLRERLMTAAASELVPAAPVSQAAARLTVTPKRSSRERRLAAAVGGLAIVGATTSMAVAAQSALPGDVLYPLKRAMENAHTGVSVSDGSKGTTLLANAAGRLAEADALSRADEGQDLAAIEQTLADFTDQATQASDLLLDDYASTGHESSISELRDFTVSSMGTLEDLSAVLPPQAQSALVTAGTLLAQIDQTTQSICPTCAGDVIDRIPRFLAQAAEQIASDLLDPPAAPSAGPSRAPQVKQTSSGPRPAVSPSAAATSQGPSLLTPPSAPAGGGTQSGSDDNPLTNLGNGGLLGGNGNNTGTGTGTATSGGDLSDLTDPVVDLVKDLTDPLLPGNDN